MDTNEIMNTLDEMDRCAIRELKTLTQKSTLSATEIKAATDAVCLLLKTQMYRNGGSEMDMDGNSFRMWPGVHSMNSMNMDGWSNARGRSPVTGRYISRDSGYSSHSINDKMIAKLEMAYDDAASQYEREEIRKEIEHLRNRSN